MEATADKEAMETPEQNFVREEMAVTAETAHQGEMGAMEGMSPLHQGMAVTCAV